MRYKRLKTCEKNFFFLKKYGNAFLKIIILALTLSCKNKFHIYVEEFFLKNLKHNLEGIKITNAFF